MAIEVAKFCLLALHIGRGAIGGVDPHDLNSGVAGDHEAQATGLFDDLDVRRAAATGADRAEGKLHDRFVLVEHAVELIDLISASEV